MPKYKEEWKVYKNVFSEFSLRTLFKLSSKGHFEELLEPILTGKEANIFSANTKDDGIIIVKIYRLENCNFNKMYQYIAADPRYLKLKKQRRATVFSWTQREFKNLMIAQEAIKVPTPIAFKNNIILMEMIGEPAPMLKDAIPKNPELFMKKIVQNVKKLREQGLVHADLSEFNILNHDEKPIFIDFSQATLTKAPNAKELYERDINNIRRFFKKLLSEKKVDNLLKSVQ
ncbi:MAG: serine protein kinase RIO [Nanoarchaeota archaeon]|nr:serine protein kinase RIO [DPANN group archaeon]MBL7116317.1 serine protein kinase RIO [Nanoarchaeota archaeon]